MSPQLTLRGIWRWYWALLVANALDLLLTYVAVQRGLQETNRVLQPILFTPWPIVLKFSALGILAVGLLYVTPTGRPPPVPRPAHGARGRRLLPERPALPPPGPGLRLANPAPRRRAASRHDGDDPLNPRESRGQQPPAIALVGAGVEFPRTGAEVDTRRLLAVGVHGVAQHDAVPVVGEAPPQPFPRAAP